MTAPRWLVTAAPHLAGKDSTPKIMWNVVLSLVPIVAAAIYFFGLSAILVLVASTLGALVPEWIWGKKRSLFDGSAVITGILLGLTLPPGFPCWMAFVGGFFGLAFGKLVFGGLGQNPFNPALLGRAFLQAAFPVAITTWPKAVGGFFALKGDNLALPLMSPDVPDLVTEATPLGLMKFEQVPTGFSDLFLGFTGGSLGETSALLILICGGYLALRNYLNWRIPASIFATVVVFSGVLYLIDSKAFPTPIFMLFSGGLMLGAVYMATDMVTSPTSNLGCWVFGLGIGALVVIIRLWGGYPEGVMYAILLMNCLVGFINRVTHPRLFGSRQKIKVVT
ncbi:MAG: RnfABCDGE type electron transport complex subunit D [Planctomycetota bacterium]|jgi:electron transport complex protein RnfD